MANTFPKQGTLINTMPHAVREPFLGTNLDTAFWSQSAVGAGQTFAVSNGSAVFTMGVTPNAETYITSKDAWAVPLRTRVSLMLSQKIAQNSVFVELVAMKGQTPGTEDVVASWNISGTDSVTTTQAVYEVQNGGASRLRASSVTVPTVTAQSIYEIEITPDEVWFHAVAPDSTGGRTNSYQRNSIVPDPSQRYALRIRVKNGASAPATSTTVTVAFATITDFTEVNAEITGGRSGSHAGMSVPVIVNGMPTTTVQQTFSATQTGTTNAKVLSAATTNATSVKTTSGRLFAYDIVNTSAAAKFVKFYNKASAPTVGTDVPVFTVALPPNGRATFAPSVPLGVFSAGIAYAITAGAADNDTAVVAANDVIGHIQYL